MALISPGLDGYMAAQQLGQQKQAQEIGVLMQLAQLQRQQKQDAQAAEMRPLQLDLLKAQIAEKNATVENTGRQRLAQGALSGLLASGGYSGPMVAPTAVAQNDAEALRMVQEADAKGIPMGVNVPNPANVRTLTSMAFPAEYGRAAATAMFREPPKPTGIEAAIAYRNKTPEGSQERAFADAYIAKQTSHAPAPSAMVKVDNFTPASEEAQKDFMKSTRATYDQLKQAAPVLDNIEKVKQLIPKASGFMGTGGEPLLDSVKFLNNRLGLGIATEGVKSAEELRSRTFFQILDNLKKMDAQPSQQQQAVMRDALGQLGTDPNALGNILDAFGDAIRTKVELHNKEVISAEQRGVKFPYSPIIELRPKGAQPSTTAQPTAPMQPTSNGVRFLGFENAPSR